MKKIYTNIIISYREGVRMSIDRSVNILKMMANPIRLGILKMLAEHEPGVCVGGIEERLSIPQSSVSQHLAHLRNTGILTCEKKGKKVCYRILDDKILNILKCLDLEDE